MTSLSFPGRSFDASTGSLDELIREALEGELGEASHEIHQALCGRLTEAPCGERLTALERLADRYPRYDALLEHTPEVEILRSLAQEGEMRKFHRLANRPGYRVALRPSVVAQMLVSTDPQERRCAAEELRLSRGLASTIFDRFSATNPQSSSSSITPASVNAILDLIPLRPLSRRPVIRGAVNSGALELLDRAIASDPDYSREWYTFAFGVACQARREAVALHCLHRGPLELSKEETLALVKPHHEGLRGVVETVSTGFKGRLMPEFPHLYERELLSDVYRSGMRELVLELLKVRGVSTGAALSLIGQALVKRDRDVQSLILGATFKDPSDILELFVLLVDQKRYDLLADLVRRGVKVPEVLRSERSPLSGHDLLAIEIIAAQGGDGASPTST